MQVDFEKLTADWNEIDSIILYGAGTVSRICLNLFEKAKINVTCVIDQDVNKQGKSWNDVPIISYYDAMEMLSGKKIVVTVGQTAYNGISQFLEEQGLIEFQDYCRVGQFVSEWFWNTKKMNYVYHVDMTVTTKCTLNCLNCNMFIPYFQEHCNYTYDELKRNIDLYFERVDYTVHFGLIGGEPLLNSALMDVIMYLGESYKERYGKITFTTNGSVLPSDELLEVIKNYDVLVAISNYTKVIPYHDKITQVEEKLIKFRIDYVIRQSLVWSDFGFPENPFYYDKQKMREHLAYCKPEWNGLNDGKFYYCNVSWSAEKSGRFKLCQEDYIILKDIKPNDKEECHMIVELSRRACSFCKVCGGCGIDNTKHVNAGIQKSGNRFSLT